MIHLQEFHSIVEQLLQHISFGSGLLDPDQEIISLEVDGRFTLHFELMDEACWLMHAELGPARQACHGSWEVCALRDETAAPGQPSIAVDENNTLHCWLELSLQKRDLPTVLDALDALIYTAEQLLDGAEITLVPVVTSGMPEAFPVSRMSMSGTNNVFLESQKYEY